MKTIVVTGSQGFIGSYVCKDLLDNGYRVIGIDNYSKYGKLIRPHDDNLKFDLIECDRVKEFPDIGLPVDGIIAGAAMIGGISYFHKYAYDLLAQNERILANTFDWAIRSKVRKITVLSSSMVYENARDFPSKEDAAFSIPPPFSTYGFQKLASEYFAKGAWEQYGLPYTIIRPFNCVGVGEDKALSESKITSGNIELMLSHVIPDLINKIKLGQNPLHIFGSGYQTRCFTNGADIARGIRLSLQSEKTINKAYNISTTEAITIIGLAERLWEKLRPNEELVLVNDPGFEHDVLNRIPDCTAALRDFGFKAQISLDQSLDEVIGYMVKQC